MEELNGLGAENKGGPPPPSPLTGCYLLIVVGEPHCEGHKDIILQKIAKGLLSWNVTDCLVDLEKELNIITEQALEGEEARFGERLIQFASENLVTEILIHPAVNTLQQCIRNLLSSFTKHRHIIHAGYTFQANGSWALQDGTFSYADFSEAFQEIEVQRVLKAYENSITLDIHCSAEGEWPRLPKESFAKGCKVRLNPTDVLTTGSPSITDFVTYLSPFLIPTTLESILESSDVVGNIRFSRPTLYVFPGGQGDAALFGINGFNMLLDGGYSRKACFWDFVRHLDRLDAVLLTRLNNSGIGGISSVLRRKTQEAVYPQIGHFFCNIQDKKSILSPDGDKDSDPLLINLVEEGQNIISDLKQLNLNPQSCYRDSEPIILYHKVGHGTLNMYVLSPEKNSKEVREFLQKWNSSDSRLFSTPKMGKDFVFPLQNLVSICALLIWQPANPNDTITRILYPGSTPQKKIFEGLDRLKSLEYIKHPVCTEKSIVPVKKREILDKIIPKDKKIEEKPLENGEKITENGDVVMKEKPVKKSDSLENGDRINLAKSKKSLEEQTNNKILENGGDRVPKSKPKVDNKTAKPRSESQGRKKPVSGGEKKGPPTPKKTVDNKLNGESKEKPAVERKPIRKPSPSATPAKSTKDANNRKVVEEKKQPIKREATSKQPHKEEPKEPKPKVERKPISRRPKTAKAPTSPMKKLTNGVQKPDSLGKRGKLDKEGTTDSSTVSTPSADQESVLKKDLSKLTPEEIQKIKEKELKELQEEQEAIKEIEAVFRKGEGKLAGENDQEDARKIKDVSIDDKLDAEEYLIIEKEEVEHTHEIQKLTKDSEETEKQRKSSVEEKDLPPTQTEKEETQTSDLEKAEINADDAAELNKALESVSDEKIEMTAAEKKELLDEEPKEIAESHPEEKISANIESGATTTAPTLPEDEKITLDEIKEQAIEEKHIKEDTKEKEGEKEVPKIELIPKTLEPQPKLPPAIAGIKLDRSSHIRDIVKTPDEVADLPVHEEADFAEFASDEKKLNEKMETDTKRKLSKDKDEDTNVLEKAELETKEKETLKEVEDKKDKKEDKITEKEVEGKDLNVAEDLIHALKDEIVSEFIENNLKENEDATKEIVIETGTKDNITTGSTKELELSQDLKETLNKVETISPSIEKVKEIHTKVIEETGTKDNITNESTKELELSQGLKEALNKVETITPTIEEVKEIHTKVIEEKLTTMKDDKEEVEKLDEKIKDLKEDQTTVQEMSLDKDKPDLTKIEQPKGVKSMEKRAEELTKLDDKLQKLKDEREVKIAKDDEPKTEKIQTAVSKSPEIAEKVTLPDSSPEEDELKVLEELKHIDKSELGRKSPQEREKDVEKIVAGVAEVLKSDVPIEVLAEKLPFAQSFTQELRETHITTQDSPIIESKIIENIPTIPEEQEEKTSDTEHKAESKPPSETADQQKSLEDTDDAGTVHRMLVTASSEDGGEEIEICPPGTIIFARSSESSGRSSPDPAAKVSHKSSIVDTLSETLSTVKQGTAERYQEEDADETLVEKDLANQELGKVKDKEPIDQEAKNVEAVKHEMINIGDEKVVNKDEKKIEGDKQEIKETVDEKSTHQESKKDKDDEQESKKTEDKKSTDQKAKKDLDDKHVIKKIEGEKIVNQEVDKVGDAKQKTKDIEVEKPTDQETEKALGDKHEIKNIEDEKVAHQEGESKQEIKRIEHVELSPKEVKKVDEDKQDTDHLEETEKIDNDKPDHQETKKFEHDKQEMKKIEDGKATDQDTKKMQDEKFTHQDSKKVEQEKELISMVPDSSKSSGKSTPELTPDAKETLDDSESKKSSEKSTPEILDENILVEETEKSYDKKLSSQDTKKDGIKAKGDTKTRSGESTPEPKLDEQHTLKEVESNIAIQDAEKATIPDKEALKESKSAPETTSFFGSLKSAIDTAKDFVEEKLTELSKDTSETLETIKDAKDSVLEDIKEKADHTIMDSMETVKHIKDKAKEAVTEKETIIHEKVQEPKGKVDEGLQKIGEGVEEVDKKVSELTQDTKDTVKSQVEQSKILMNDLKEKTYEKLDEGVQKLQRMVAKDQEKIEELEREMKDEVEKDTKKITKLETEISDLKREIDAKKGSFKEDIVPEIKKIDDNLNDLEKISKEKLGETVTKVDDLSKEVKHEIKEHLDSAKTKIEDVKGSLTQSVNEIKQLAEDDMKHIVGESLDKDVSSKGLSGMSTPKSSGKTTPEKEKSVSPSLSGKFSPDHKNIEPEVASKESDKSSSSNLGEKTGKSPEGLTDKVIKEADELIEKSEHVLSSILAEKDEKAIPDNLTDIKDFISSSEDTDDHARSKREVGRVEKEVVQPTQQISTPIESKTREPGKTEGVDLKKESEKRIEEQEKPADKTLNDENSSEEYKVDKETVEKEEKQIEDEVEHLEKAFDSLTKLDHSISFEKCQKLSEEQKAVPEKKDTMEEFEIDKETREQEEKQLEAKVLHVQKSLEKLDDLSKSIIFEKCSSKDDFKIDPDVIKKEEKFIDEEVEHLKHIVDEVTELQKEVSFDKVSDVYKVDEKTIEKDEKQIEKQVESLEKTLSEVEKLEESMSFDKCSISSTASTVRISDNEDIKELDKTKNEVLGSAEYDVLNDAISQKRKSLSEVLERKQSLKAEIDQVQKEFVESIGHDNVDTKSILKDEVKHIPEIKEVQKEFIESVEHDTEKPVSVEKGEKNLEEEIKTIEERFIDSVTHDTDESVSVEKDKKKVEDQIKQLEEQFIESVAHDTAESISIDKDKRKVEGQIKELEEQFIESATHDTEENISLEKDKKKIKNQIKEVEEQFIESATHDTKESISPEKDKKKIEDQIKKVEEQFIESVIHDTAESISIDKDKKKVENEIKEFEKQFIESVTHDTEESISLEKDKKKIKDQIEEVEEQFIESAAHDTKESISLEKDKKKIEDQIKKVEEQFIESVTHDTAESISIDKDKKKVENEIKEFEKQFIESVTHDTEESISLEKDKKKIEDQIKEVEEQFIESVTHDIRESVSIDKDQKKQENEIKALQESFVESLEHSDTSKEDLTGSKNGDKPEKCDLEKKLDESAEKAEHKIEKADEIKKEIKELQDSFLDSIPSDRSISPESDRETSFEKELKMVDNKFLEERSKVGDSSKLEEKYDISADRFNDITEDVKDLKLVDKKLSKSTGEKTDAPEKSDKDSDIQKDATPKHSVDTITTEVKMDFVEAEYKSIAGKLLDTEKVDTIQKETDIRKIVDKATPEVKMDFVEAEYKAITGKPLVMEKGEGESMEKTKVDTLEIENKSDVKKLSISDVEIKFQEQPSIKDITRSFLDNETIIDQIDSKVFKRPEDEQREAIDISASASKTSDLEPLGISTKQVESELKPVESVASSSTLQISSTAADLSGKSSPDISGKTTAPVSPSLKDSQSTEPKMGSKVDSGLSEQTETDDDDLSTKSQVAQSDLEEMDQQLEKLDPMSMSFYGALPDEPDSFLELPGTYLYEVTKAKYAVKSEEEPEQISTKQDPMTISFAGELPPPAKSSGRDDVMTSSFIGTLPEAGSQDTSKKDVVDQWGKPLGLPSPTYHRAHYSSRNQQFDVMSSSFIGELPSVDDNDDTDPPRPDLMNTSVYFDPSEDPIASWGKPLGLPSPAPPNNNSQGTPKKEKKLPSNVATKNKLNDDRKRAESPSKTKNNRRINPVYVDLTYVPHHGNHFYSYVDFFKRVRARYYVFSGLEPSRQVYDALLEAKQTWEDKDLEVTIIPTYDTDILGYWVAENEDLLTKAKIDLSPSASRCTINLQDHETSCAAYRLEF